MKKPILIISILFMAITMKAGTPPAAVSKAFAQKFPTATDVKWGKENASEWEAEFKLKTVKNSANFSLDGTWLETETEIPVSELPASVSSAIMAKYPGCKITGGDKIESFKKGILYEADIKTGVIKKEVILKVDGTFTK